MSRVEVLSWDYREQPDLARLGNVVAEMSGGRVWLTSVDDTGGQDYVLAVADRPLTQDEAMDAYDRSLE